MKKRIFISLLATVALVFSFYIGIKLSNENKLLELGYSEQEVEAFSNEMDLFTGVSTIESQLFDEIAKQENIIVNEIGIELIEIQKEEELTKVAYLSHLKESIVILNEEYDALSAELDLELEGHGLIFDIDTSEMSKKAVVDAKQEHIDAFLAELAAQLEGAKARLVELGRSNEEIDSYLTGDTIQDIARLNDRISYYEEYNSLLSTYGNSEAEGAMRLLGILNAKRVEVGLQPYEYREDQQACVDMEANSYANNKNPHNWLCKTLVSEGASLASVNSDYIGIAGNFLTTHGSHLAGVTNPEWTGAACSAIRRDKMVYMICGYFR